MRWPLVLALALSFCAPSVMHGQGFDSDFDIGGFINQGGKAEAQAFADSLTGSGQSVVDTMNDPSNQAAVTGNDYVEGALQQGIKVLGKGAVPELPIADAASAAGSYAGGDTQGAADTAVSGTMGAIAGWGVGALVEGLAVDGVIVVGTVSAPAWIPAVIAGATAGMLVKGIYGWMLQPVQADAPSKPQSYPNLTTTRATPTQSVAGGTKSLGPPPPPLKKHNENSDHHEGNHDSGGRSGCSDGH
jgi:hypothetical protein